uniref:Uncharacterized protein n=2 Tax=Cyprinus carpio TaxID=7962 RepID=A0A8C2JNQ9_CYPCA
MPLTVIILLSKFLLHPKIKIQSPELPSVEHKIRRFTKCSPGKMQCKIYEQRTNTKLSFDNYAVVSDTCSEMARSFSKPTLIRLANKLW